MMKTIARQPVLFSDVPVADLRDSIKPKPEMTILERLWNKIRDFFRDSDKQKAFKSIEKYIKTLSDLNCKSASTPVANFNIDSTSDLDSYLNLGFNHLSPKQKQTTLCCFWNKIASTLPESSYNSIQQNITFSEDEDGTPVMHGAIFILDEEVNNYSIRIDKDQDGKLDLSGLYLAHSNISNMTVQNCNLSNANFEHSTFVNIDFSDSNCTNSDFNNCIFEKCNLKNVNFTAANLNNAIIYGTKPENHNSWGNYTKGMILTGSSCIKTTLTDVDLSETNCTDTDLSEAICLRVIFPGPDMMKGAKLYRTVFYTKTSKEEVEEEAEPEKSAESEEWEVCEEPAEPVLSTLSKIILQYLRSDKNPESLTLDKKSVISRTQNDIYDFIYSHKYLDEIFNRTVSNTGGIDVNRFYPAINEIKKEAREEFTRQYKSTKKDMLRNVPLTIEAIAKSKMDVLMKQLLINSETENEIKTNIKEEIDNYSEALFNTINESITHSFNGIFMHELYIMSRNFSFVAYDMLQ